MQARLIHLKSSDVSYYLNLQKHNFTLRERARKKTNF